MPTAIIADDERLMRDLLRTRLSQVWPDLTIVGEAKNGDEAVQLVDELKPDLTFLDIRMPGKTGMEAARDIGDASQVVFVTAYDQYAVQAFEQGALDYLVKPVEPARLADTVERLQQRLRAAQPAGDTEALLEQLVTRLRRDAAPAALRWLRVSVGQNVRLIAVDEIDFLRADEKYTLVAWRGDAGKPCEGLIRTPLKELVAQLDAAHFAQVHRSVVVNLRAISHVTRGENETADIHLKGRANVLPVSRTHLHLFRQM